MKNFKIEKLKNSQRGVSLIITFFIMIIILAVVLSVSVLLYSEIKVIRNIGNSTIALYSADSGIEKVLFYDRRAVPEGGATRGLCSIFDNVNNSFACPQNTNIYGTDDSIYCNNPVAPHIYVDPSANPNGCNPATCDNCEISFKSNFGDTNQPVYSVTARVYPTKDGKSNFEIDSKGSFGGSERQIQVLNTMPKYQGIIRIENACATPKSVQSGGGSIYISALVSINAPGTDSIGQVSATIHNLAGTVVGTVSLLPENCSPLVANEWCGSWPANALADSYFVDIDAQDTICSYQPDPTAPCDNNEQKCTNLYPDYLCTGLCTK